MLNRLDANIIDSYNLNSSFSYLGEEDTDKSTNGTPVPDKIKEEDTEFNNTCNVALIVDYIKRTEKLIRPYYSKKEKEEN